MITMKRVTTRAGLTITISARKSSSRKPSQTGSTNTPTSTRLIMKPPNFDPDIARDAKQLNDVLTKCAIGATKFKERFSRAQLERMVKRELKTRFKNDPKYSKHVREDVPGLDPKA